MESGISYIKLTTNFMVPGKENDRLPLPLGVDTLEQLLAHLGEKIHFDFIDPLSGKLEWDLEILINGRDFSFSPAGLGTSLKDGDSLEIYLLPLGGG
jgi:hypothetical protein